MSKLSDLMGGTIGYFWPDPGAPDPGCALAGHASLGPDGQMLVDVLVPHEAALASLHEPVDIPHSVVAATSVGGALFLDVRGVRDQGNLVGVGPATRQYRCGAVVVDAPINRLRSHDLLSVTAFMPGIGPWAGLSASEERLEHDEQGLLQSWSVKLQSSVHLTEPLTRGRTLSMATHWQVDGPMDHRLLYAPVSLTISSKRPSSWVNLVQPLMVIQGLISLAFGGLVLADGGQVQLDLDAAGGEPSASPTWWTSRLMQQPPGALVVGSITESPSFHLETLGGVAGLRRWVALENRFPRAVGPLVSPHRFGPTHVETRLLEVAAGIEYWVASHRRQAKWTRAGDSHAHALALSVGAPFREWTGEPSEWARRFWDTYNLLKHRPNESYDPYGTSLLAQSGAVLLQCAVLNRAGGSRRPALSVCQSHRYYELGRQLRDFLTA